jgi:hypothetical protein
MITLVFDGSECCGAYMEVVQMWLSELSPIIRRSPYPTDAVLSASLYLQRSGFTSAQILDVIVSAITLTTAHGGNGADFINLIRHACRLADNIGPAYAIRAIKGELPEIGDG